MSYKGNIEIINGFVPKNNGDFPLVEAKDVYVNDNTRLDDALDEVVLVQDTEPTESANKIWVNTSSDGSSSGGVVVPTYEEYETLRDDQVVRYDVEQTLTDAQKAQARDNIEAASADEVDDLKQSLKLNNNLTPKIQLSPNPKTINGVTITVNGPGSVTLKGTCTGSFRLDFFSDDVNYPDGMSRATEYYTALTGTDKFDTYIRSNESGSFQAIVQVTTDFKKFNTPSSGGLQIMTVAVEGKSYDETIDVIILNKNVYTEGVAQEKAITAINDASIANNVANTANTIATRNGNILFNSNIDLDYATVSTASKVHNGLTFKAEKGTVTIDGTSTGIAYFDVISKTGNPTEFMLDEGKTYTLKINDEGNARLYKQIEYKSESDSNWVTSYSKTVAKDTISFTVPPNVYDWHIRLVCDAAGVSYSNQIIHIEIRDIATKDVIIVDVNGGGDFTSLKDAISVAMQKYGTKVIVKRGTYNLVSEFGKEYLDNLSGGDYGIMLGNGIELFFAPNAYVSFDYDGTNEWIIANFSPFNTANDLGFTIDGLHCTAVNCRYILHDDPRPGVKDRESYNTIKNSYLELFPSPQYSNWVNHQIIGGGLGDSTIILIENCIFNDHFSGVSRYNAVSYHNSTSGNNSFESRVIIKDCYFANGNALGFEGYGASTMKTKIIVTNNSLQNGDNDISYNSSQADNITMYIWNNHSRE